MLGRLRRTTRLDVSLALAFSGLSYLVWVLVAGTARDMVRDLIPAIGKLHIAVPPFTNVVKIFFVDMGFVIDIVGLVWMVVSLLLVVYSGRQKLSISWAWLSAVLQSFIAALGGVMVGRAMSLPYGSMVGTTRPSDTDLAKLSEVSLWVILTVAILIWVTCLVWLMIERAHFKSRGPTLRDGMRSNIYP